VKGNFLEINSRFSYDRKQCLGAGSFGTAYVGWDNQESRAIAVKIILPHALKKNKKVE
jgi:serine/threonine protein kinase